MKYAKRIVSLFLLLAVTASSVLAFDTPATQSISVNDSTATIQNPNPQITLKYPDSREDSGIYIYTNFQKSSNANEMPLLYRSINGGKFKPLPDNSRKVFYLYYDWTAHTTDGPLYVEDLSCKNGNFYRYKLATMVADPSTGKNSAVAYSNVKSRYYLEPMCSIDLFIKNSANKKSMTISWKKQCNPKADGYQLRYYYYTRYATHPKVSKQITRTVKGAKTSKYTLKHRSPNKQYWVQIRSYKKYKGTTYYSNWSDYEGRYL